LLKAIYQHLGVVIQLLAAIVKKTLAHG